MPRPKRAGEAGGIYHTLIRGNARSDNPSQAQKTTVLAYQLMANHWHIVLAPTEDGGMSRFLGWVAMTHTMRFHAHYHTVGEGHAYHGRFKSFPIQDDDHFHVACRYVERNALRAGLVKRAENWKWGSLHRWLQRPEPDPKLLSHWPISRLPRWRDRVSESLGKQELKALRWSKRNPKSNHKDQEKSPDTFSAFVMDEWRIDLEKERTW